jgi:hypothetical protein
MSKAWILGEFPEPNAMMAAARKLREAGHADLDGYSPYPLHGLDEALGLARSRIPLLVFGGGMTGAIGGYLLQWWCNAVDYPINVGGRPPHSPPAFIPVTFELAILLGAFGAFFGLMMLMRLPRLHHPVFEAEAFRSASLDRFWVSVCTADTDKADEIRRALSELGASETAIVEEPV